MFANVSVKAVTAAAFLAVAAFCAGGCQNAAPTASAAPSSDVSSSAGVEKTNGAEWVGRTVTPFSLPDADGKTVNIADVLGKQPVVLIFYRGNWCPFCNAQMAELSAAKEKFVASGAKVYAISNEDAAALKAMQSKHALDFVTFLSDGKAVAAKQFGGTYPGQTILKPVTLVIDKNSKVTYAYTNEDYKIRAVTQDVIDAVAKAK